MKQSLRARLPAINNMTNFSELLEFKADQRFVAHARISASHLFTAAEPGKSYLVLIGPEGDFSEDELTSATATGLVPITLGDYRLRTETAAFAVVQALVLKNI